MTKSLTDDESKGYRYGKSGSHTVLEEYDREAEGWYTMATLHEPDENRTGERLVTALTTLDDRDALNWQLAAVVEAVETQDKRLVHYASGQDWFDNLPERAQLEKLLADSPAAQEIEAKLCCIDCGRLLTGISYGAGTGEGQQFRCEHCHNLTERVEKLAEALREHAEERHRYGGHEEQGLGTTYQDCGYESCRDADVALREMEATA